MKKGLLLVLAAVVLAIVGYLRTAGLPDAPVSGSVFEVGPERTYVRAAHWFGDAWAINFWQTDLESRARSDFEKILDDGFNTLVLLVPWPGFAPDPHSGRLDEVRVERLLGLMRLADEMGLKVILRVSYSHDATDDEHGWRSHHVWLDDDYYQGWLDYLAALWARVGDEPNLLFGFFSWEDLWAYVEGIGEQERALRDEAARQSGFGEWLSSRYSLEEVSTRFGRQLANWDEIEIPQRREPTFELFLEFVDYLWIERFFLPAQQRFPRMSMEIRIDSDPVWDGEKLVKWHNHREAWNLPGAEWVTLYWSPAMGGKNQGESLSPQIAAERLEWWLEEVSAEIGPRNIFIGQFLAEDFTPGFEQNGRIPRDQVSTFLKLAGDILARLTGGYGLWTWTDYGHNTVNNPEFYAGLDDWQYSDNVEIVDDGVRLDAGEWIAFTSIAEQSHTHGTPETAELCVNARSLDDNATAIEIRDRLNERDIGRIEFAVGGGRECMVVSLEPSMLIEFEALDGVVVRGVEHIDFVQESGMRYRDGSLKEVAAAYRALNDRLTERVSATQPLYDDGWMGRHLAAYFESPGRATSLHLETHLPDQWPVEPMLSVSVDGALIDQVPCVRDGEYMLQVDGDSLRKDWVQISIEASAVHEPDSDSRRLGCLVSRFELAVPENP